MHGDSFITCSMEFTNVHILTLHFNFYATLFMQFCSVAFNKPNENVLTCQLILCLYLSHGEQLINMDEIECILCFNTNMQKA